jgi:hypothetical protein
MGGMALSAATWGIVRPYRAAAAAIVAVTATTVLLVFVNSEDKPAGIRLLEGPARESIRTMPAEWGQNLQPELVPVTRVIRKRAEPGETIAATRDARLPSGSRHQLPIAVRCRRCLRAFPS